MKEILLVLDGEEMFRQELHQWQGIDLDKFISKFEEEGYKISITNYDELINKRDLNNLKEKKIIYTSSQKLNYKSYIDDILFELSLENQLMPKYEIFKAHENKSYQELYKNRTGLNSLKNYSFGCLKDIYKYKEELEFPIVFKSLTGAGSLGVSLAKNFSELEEKVKKETLRKDSLEFKAKKLIKKNLIKSKYDKEFYEIDKYIGRFLLQEFVPNLENDWKILIFGDKYYVLNRKVRKNDFRASGSGKLDYVEPPKEVLEFAKECFEKLDMPLASLDVCMDKNKKCYLIEYQGLHFGPYTLINSEWYYEYQNKGFIKKEGKSDLAIEYANAYIKYLECGGNQEKN